METLDIAVRVVFPRDSIPEELTDEEVASTFVEELSELIADEIGAQVHLVEISEGLIVE